MGMGREDRYSGSHCRRYTVVKLRRVIRVGQSGARLLELDQSNVSLGFSFVYQSHLLNLFTKKERELSATIGQLTLLYFYRIM